MAIERITSIMKPDAVAKNITSQIYSRFEQNGLRIIATKTKHLSVYEAQDFYAVRKECPLYADLVVFMTSGPVMIQVLEGENAVAKNHELIGAVDLANAAPGTIRADFAESLSINAVHGSDSLENATVEISYFFSQSEICPRWGCGRMTANRRGHLKRECSGG